MLFIIIINVVVGNGGDVFNRLDQVHYLGLNTTFL